MKRILIIAFAAVSMMAQAQQDPQITMYRFDGLMFNPAYAGSRDALSIAAIGRLQWLGLPGGTGVGSPVTGDFSIHSPLKNDNIALGLNVIYDQYTIVYTGKVSGDFAYRIPVGKQKKVRISLGLGVSATMLNSQFSNVQLAQAGDKSFQNNTSLWLPNVSAGIYVYSPKFFIGVSVPEILPNSLSSKGQLWQTSMDSAHQYISLNATAGYVFDLGKKVKFAPSILMQYVPKYAPISMAFNANFIFVDRLWLGVSYRLSDSYGFMAAVSVTPQLRIGYAYDLTVSSISHFATYGTHEVHIGYDFDFRKKGIVNPRYVRYF